MHRAFFVVVFSLLEFVNIGKASNVLSVGAFFYVRVLLYCSILNDKCYFLLCQKAGFVVIPGFFYYIALLFT